MSTAYRLAFDFSKPIDALVLLCPNASTAINWNNYKRMRRQLRKTLHSLKLAFIMLHTNNKFKFKSTIILNLVQHLNNNFNCQIVLFTLLGYLLAEFGPTK